MWYMHDVGWGWWLLMSVGMVAFWGLVIYGILVAVRGASSPSRDEPRPELPLAILERRLATGDISVNEYA